MNFTYEYFLEERLRFRQIMDERDVMLDEDKRRCALNGYAYIYLNTRTDKPIEDIFWADMEEFTRRCLLIDTHIEAAQPE
jgi:hypothetical protein